MVIVKVAVYQSTAGRNAGLWRVEWVCFGKRTGRGVEIHTFSRGGFESLWEACQMAATLDIKDRQTWNDETRAVEREAARP